MKRAVMALSLILAFLAAILAEETAAIATPVGTKELIDHARDYDGREIVFEGEAIGDPMHRGDHAWINVLDSNAAMGVFMPARYAAFIANYGSNRRTGDRLRVSGVFHRACPDHGGEMDIHARSVEIIARGTETPHPIEGLRLALVPVFLFLAAIFYYLWRRREAAAKSRKRLF